MKEDKYNLLLEKITLLEEKVDSVQETVDVIDKDMEQDREKFAEWVQRLGAVEGIIVEFRKLLNRIPERTQDRVAEAVQPMINEVHDLEKTINKKKTLILKEKKQSWLKRWFWK